MSTNKQPESVELIWKGILGERVAQDNQWGGKEHDDSHERFEWLNYIAKQTRMGLSVAHNPEQFEARMIKIAALAVAAIESSRRQR
jgi:hypothetical protein